LKLGNVNLKGGQYVVNVEGKNGRLTPFKANVANKPSRINANRVKSPNVIVEEEYVALDLDQIKNDRIQENFAKLPQQQISTQSEEVYDSEFSDQQNQKIKIDTVEQFDQEYKIPSTEAASDNSQQGDTVVKLPSNQQNFDNYTAEQTYDGPDDNGQDKPAIQNLKPTLQQISQSANVINPNNISNAEFINVQKDELDKALSEQQLLNQDKQNISYTNSQIINEENKAGAFSPSVTLNQTPGIQKTNELNSGFDTFDEEDVNNLSPGKNNNFTENLTDNQFSQIPGKTVVNQNQPGVNQNQPGVAYNQIPGVNQNQPGVNQNQPGVNQNQPGVNQNQIPGQTNASENNSGAFGNSQEGFDNDIASGQSDKVNATRINQNQVANKSLENASSVQSELNENLTSNKNTDEATFGALPQAPIYENGVLVQQSDYPESLQQTQYSQAASGPQNQADNKIVTDNSFIYQNQTNSSATQNPNGLSNNLNAQSSALAADPDNNLDYQKLQQNDTVENYANNQGISPSSNLNINEQLNNQTNFDPQNQRGIQNIDSATMQEGISSESYQEKYNAQDQAIDQQNQRPVYKVGKLPTESAAVSEIYYDANDDAAQVSNNQRAISTNQTGQVSPEFEIINNNQQSSNNQDKLVNKSEPNNEAEEVVRTKQNDVLSKLNESFNKASKAEELLNQNKQKQEDDSVENKAKFLDEQGNLKRVILESLPQQAIQQANYDEVPNANPRVAGFNVSNENDPIEEEETSNDSLPIRKRIKYITIGGNVIAALQSVDVPENSESTVDEKAINDQIKKQINDENKPLEDQVYSSLLKEREVLQSKLSDLENNKAYLRKAEENIQNQLVYLVANDQVVDNLDNSSSSPLNQIIQNFINEDRSTVENFKQETINQAIQMISGQKEIDEILLRQRIERELRYEFNQMQLDHEQKMKIIYRRMIESMYSDLLNN
jgi:hypothetical protein